MLLCACAAMKLVPCHAETSATLLGTALGDSCNAGQAEDGALNLTGQQQLVQLVTEGT